MTFKPKSAMSLSAILALVALVVVPSRMAQAREIGAALYFAAGWRAPVGIDENVVQLGVVFRCGEDWCLERETFSGSKNLGFTPLAVRHQMRAPLRSPACTDGPIKTVEGAIDKAKGVRFTATADGWELETEDLRYVWRIAAGSYATARLDLIVMTAKNVRAPLEQVVGVGYVASDVLTIGSLDAMKQKYDGEISHKDMNAKVADQWFTKRSIHDFLSYVPTDTDPSVWSLTLTGHRDVVKRLGKNLWVANAVTIAPARAPHLTYVVHEYGHDFNGNGCFDEPGHNKLMLPVLEAGRVVALPYVEYTPDPKDGVPMLSVGSYFLRASQLRPADSADLDRR